MIAAQRASLTISASLSTKAGALLLRGRHVARGAPAFGGVDHLLRLGAELLLDDGNELRLIEQRLENLIFVWIDGALHDVLTQAPGGIDQHHILEAGLGVDREHHASPAEIGADHALHADRQRHFQMIETLGLAIADGAVGEQRGIAAPASIEQRRVASNIEKGLLLAGKAGVGQVFGRGAGADRNVDIGFPRAPAEILIGRLDALGDIGRPVALQHRMADRLAGLGKRGLAGGQVIEHRADRLAQAVRLDEAPIGIRRGGEAGRDIDALAAEIAHHLAERGVLAADDGNVPAPQLLEPDYIGVLWGAHCLLPYGNSGALAASALG